MNFPGTLIHVETSHKSQFSCFQPHLLLADSRSWDSHCWFHRSPNTAQVQLLRWLRRFNHLKIIRHGTAVYNLLMAASQPDRERSEAPVIRFRQWLASLAVAQRGWAPTGMGIPLARGRLEGLRDRLAGDGNRRVGFWSREGQEGGRRGLRLRLGLRRIVGTHWWRIEYDGIRGLRFSLRSWSPGRGWAPTGAGCRRGLG